MLSKVKGVGLEPGVAPGGQGLGQARHCWSEWGSHKSEWHMPAPPFSKGQQAPLILLVHLEPD
jgi:hypothetical protein